MNPLDGSDTFLAEVSDRDPSITSTRSADPKARPPGILIVDDDDAIRRMLRAGLKNRGFTIWLAGSAEEAIEMYRLHHHSLDLVLLDVRMPGMDGPETLARLREFDPKIRACFMTGDAGRYSEDDLHDLGAVAVIRKPIPLSELANQLAGLITPIDPYSDEASK